MQDTVNSLSRSLAPVEELFVTWLTRVFVVALVAGTAWIDDAPPLELVAYLMTVYLIIRVVTQFGALLTAGPSQNRVLRIVCAVAALLMLANVFLVTVIFANTLALAALD